MINTKKIDARSTPQNMVLLAGSPEELRMVANRLEQMAMSAKDGESVVYPFATGFWLCYQPESQSVVRDLTGPAVVQEWDLDPDGVALLSFWIWALAYYAISTTLFAWCIACDLLSTRHAISDSDRVTVGMAIATAWLTSPVLLVLVWSPSAFRKVRLHLRQRKEVTRR